MAAQNADEPNTDNTGMQQAQIGDVTITAQTDNDLHLGDGRVIYGRGNGMIGEIDPDTGDTFAFPQKAKVTKDVADDLVRQKKAKRG